MAQGINRALAEHHPVVVRPLMGQPKAFRTTRGKSREIPVLDLKAAEAFLIEMREQGISVRRIDADTTGKTRQSQQRAGKGTFIYKIGMAWSVQHLCIFAL